MGCRTLPTSDPPPRGSIAANTSRSSLQKLKLRRDHGLLDSGADRRSTSTADSSKFLAANKILVATYGPRGTVALYALTFTFGPEGSYILLAHILGLGNRFFVREKPSENVFIDISRSEKQTGEHRRYSYEVTKGNNLDPNDE